MGHHAAPVDVMQQSDSPWVLQTRPAPEEGRGRKGKGREGKGKGKERSVREKGGRDGKTGRG